MNYIILKLYVEIYKITTKIWGKREKKKKSSQIYYNLH